MLTQAVNISFLKGAAVDRQLEHPPLRARGLRHLGGLRAVGHRLQTLRLYERRGLLNPSRTDGGIRRYSDDDLQRLARITELVDQGINLAGVAQILDLETKNRRLESDYTQLELLNAKLKAGRSAAGKK